MKDHVNTKTNAKLKHVVVRIPRLGTSPSDPWVDDTYALIDRFARDPQSTSPQALEEASIIAASDYLWTRFGLEAPWGRLQVDELLAMFWQFAADPQWRRQCLNTLKVFYGFLLREGAVDLQQRTRIDAQLASHLSSLDGANNRSSRKLPRCELTRAERRQRRAEVRRRRC